jgi:MFS family permease
MVDRLGVERSARLMGLALFASGLIWAILPSTWIAIGAAVVFATAAGALFPMANVVAVQQFGALGGLLGVFRSVQMGIAALSVTVFGVAASWFGMRPALGFGMLALLPILRLRSPGSSPDPALRNRS